MKTFDLDAEIAKLIDREGGYVNDPNDAGGETNFGITEFVARANGYHGAMQEMTRQTAEFIYKARYWHGPHIDRVNDLSVPIAAELFDTGVNMGTATAARFLQRALNAFNSHGALWPEITVDGAIGALTLHALRTFLARRWVDGGEAVMVRTLNCLQGARYIELGEANQKNESFVFGWMANRVA